MGKNQYWAGRVYDLCVYYMTGTPKGSTESGFMEKPGIEPATPGLQGIGLIHYTTGASHLEKIHFKTYKLFSQKLKLSVKCVQNIKKIKPLHLLITKNSVFHKLCGNSKLKPLFFKRLCDVDVTHDLAYKA